MKVRFIVVIAVIVLTAGCVTGGPADGDDSATTPTAAGGGDGTDDDGDSVDGDDENVDGSSDASVSGEWEPFRFDTAATYEFDVYLADEGEGRIVWDVQSVSEDEYTVRLVYEMGDERMETTATGTKDTVMSQFYTNPGGIVLMTTMYQPSAWYQGQDLSEGTQWSYQTPEGSASFAITGDTTIAGVACSQSEMRVNGSIVHEGCFAPELGLAPHAAWYDEDGTLEMELTLVSYEPN